MTRAGTRLGRIGEQMAARHLQRAGMQVIDRNWRCQVDDLRGEVDIVARDGDELVFCEVKTRRTPTSAGPLEGITPRKLVQLRRLAAAWLAHHPETVGGRDATGILDVRLDAIGIHWPASGGRAVITHLRGIDR